MTCNGCGDTAAYHIVTKIDRSGNIQDFCNRCGGSERGSIPASPDVFWPGHPHYNNNLCDGSGKPILLESKIHKAAVMKEQGVREAGDPVNGSRALPRPSSWYEGFKKSGARR